MDSSTVTQIIILLVSIMISITLHEMMHAFTGHWLGDDTARMMGRLTLNPLAHIDPILTVALPVVLLLSGLPPIGAAKPVPFNPTRLRYGDYGAALVALAGPFTNLALAVISGLWLRFVIGFDAGAFTDAMLLFFLVNIGFFVFNMIPFPPLDGSRALYAIAPEPVRNVMQTIERGGIMSIIIFFFLLYPFLRVVVGNLILILSTFILGPDNLSF